MLARSALLLSLVGAALANIHGSNRHQHLAARDALLAAPVESSLFERALAGESSANEAGTLRLAKRSSCSRASQCKSKLKANAVHKCLSGHCAQVCKSGYKSSYGKCVKKAAAKKKSTIKKKATTTKKTTAKKAAATAKKASAASKKGTLLASSNIQSFLGTNSGIGSWYRADYTGDSTNGRSWCEFQYNDDSPVFAPSVGTMRANFGYDNQAAATAYCGLEAIVTAPDGTSKTMVIGDGFDDKWVLSPGSIDIMHGAFTSLFGSYTSNKNDVLKGVTWTLTGNRNDKYKFRGQGDA